MILTNFCILENVPLPYAWIEMSQANKEKDELLVT